MSWQAEGSRIIFKRTMMLISALCVLTLLLFARMFYLQVIEGAKYKTLADKNRISLRHLPPTRGLIFDRNGQLLALNRKTFAVTFMPENSPDKIDQVLERLSLLLPLSDNEKKRIVKEASKVRPFMNVRLKDDVSFDEMAAIQLNIPDLLGVSIDESRIRVYPAKEYAAHVVGYVQQPSETDILRDFIKMPEVRIGKTGIEQAYDEQLYGTIGSQKVEINAFGRDVRLLDTQKAVNGENLQTTLDMRLQKIGLDALGDQTGSAVLMNVHTGEILMMVSTPSFDPNIFNAPLPDALWKSLNNNPKHPLINKAIQGLYSPGSLFKIVVALAGLESGDITTSTRVNCTGELPVGNNVFHCWRRHGHGVESLKDALQHSCDIYFYQMGQKIGVDKIAQMAAKLGFGQPTGTGIAGEKAGLLPSREWKRREKNDEWRIGDTVNLSIGQGYLTATPMQMLLMMARVVNGGKAVRPTLIKPTEKPVFESLGFDPYHLALIRKGLSAVVNEKTGTAYYARFEVNGQKMGGKTASTQIRRISAKEREEGLTPQSQLPWKDRDHAFFAAYAPDNKPEYALIVAIEHGGGGSMTAAPIASQIMRKALELKKEDGVKK